MGDTIERGNTSATGVDSQQIVETKPKYVRQRNTPTWFDPHKASPCDHTPKYGFELCRKCYEKERLKQTPVEIKRRNNLSSSLATYGLSDEQFRSMLEKQHFGCAICRETTNGGKRGWRLHVDHDHKTNKVRGVLCSRCNLAIGHLRENPVLFDRAIEYLGKSWSDRYYRHLMLISMLVELLLLGYIAWKA
jgi:hypothetical protein